MCKQWFQIRQTITRWCINFTSQCHLQQPYRFARLFDSNEKIHKQVLLPHNLASARLCSTQSCLVLNSTLIYVEVPTCLPPTMMALAAKGTWPSSAYWPKTLPTTPENIEVLEGWIGFSSNPSSSIVTSHSTINNVQNHVENSVHATNDCSNHEWWQPVDLSALHCEIVCDMEWWTDLISALTSALNGAEEKSPNAKMTNAQEPTMTMVTTMQPSSSKLVPQTQTHTTTTNPNRWT